MLEGPSRVQKTRTQAFLLQTRLESESLKTSAWKLEV